MNQQRVDNSKDLTTVRLFDATHWSVVLRAKDDSVTTLNTLFGSYRKPLLALARIKGNAPQDAEDIVHGFLSSCANGVFWRTSARKTASSEPFCANPLLII